jgi:hypothetical protein
VDEVFRNSYGGDAFSWVNFEWIRKGDTMKIILSTLAAAFVAGALLTSPAQAACFAGPYGVHCGHPYYHHYWHPWHHGW